MNKHSLSISKIINGGFGLGQLADGRLAMVRQVLPGEEIVFVPEEDKKSYLVGKAASIDRPSPFRIQPPCPYYGACGGCDLQHAAYEEQLRIKRGILIDLLSRQGKLHEEDIASSVASTLPSPLTMGYRQRIRLWVKEGRSLGFRQARSHDIVAVKQCLIAKSELNDTLAALTAHTSLPQLLANSSELELLFNPATGCVTTLLHLTRKPRPADIAAAARLVHDIPQLERIFFTGQNFPLTAAAPPDCHRQLGMRPAPAGEGLPPFSLQWEVGGFCQVNLEQNSALVRLACEYAALKPEETVLDLFCGAGNFSMPLAAAAASLVGIEGQGAAIRSARINSESGGLSNTTFHKRPIHEACKAFVDQGVTFDCLVIDPPRQGVPGLAPSLHAICRSRMVYISCDPATLSRDLADLTGAGFRLGAIRPVDMFPQTHHIETVVVLEKH